MRMTTWNRMAAVTLTAMVGSAYGWEIGEPIVTYWAGPGYPNSNMPIDDAHVKQLKEGGYNVLWAQTKADLDMAAKWGMRALYHLPTARGKGWSEATRTKLAKTIAAIKDHPALYFYHQCDEPPAGWYEYLNADKEFIRSLDPNHPCWVNLLPTYANNKQLGVPGEIISAYWEHVRRFMDVYDPEFTSYDHYQLCNGYDMDDYFLNLAIVQQNAAARGIPFMNGVQTCTWWPNGSLASPSAPRIPNADELRYLVYTTLAYGAQGIYYYVYSHPGHKGSIVEQDGTISEKYYALQKLNPIFVATAKETRGFRMSGAFFRGFCPHGGTPYGARALLKFKDDVTTVDLPHHAAPTNSILVTRFDAPGRGTRLMVVNLDYRRARTLSLVAPTDAERFDPVSRSWRPLGKSFELSLDKGEGVLLRLAESVPFGRSNIIGHRGDWEEAPENSIAAFRKAVENGFGVELDLYVLSDGRVVASHTRPEPGKDYPEIGQVLDLVRPGTRFVLDLKGGGSDDQLIGPIKREMERRPSVTPETVSFFGGADWIRRNLPGYRSGHVHLLRKGWKADDPPIDDIRGEIERAAKSDAGLWAPRWDAELLSVDLIALAHEKGLKVAVWTVNDAVSAREALRRGVDFVETDRPTSLYREMCQM